MTRKAARTLRPPIRLYPLATRAAAFAQAIRHGATLITVSLLATGLSSTSMAAQAAQLGTIDFPNSGAEHAQDDFVRGVLLLHSFEFEPAAEAFRAAQAADPAFALAYWGEAMTYNHPLWREQDGDAARAALARYAPTPEARQARAPTPREAGYLAALDVLYGEGSKTGRDRAYMEAMADLTAAYPDDHEARAFWALAILGSTDGERDFATYMRAAAAAQPVFDANPDHPGAAHYIIHSFDDPVHAPLGLEAARAYADIAPGAAHAQHMTSHIFVAMGMWEDVVSANIRARDVQNAARAERGRAPNACGHYTSWLHYGWLMLGDREHADAGMAECHDLVLSGDATPAEVGYFVNMRARHVLDTRDWDEAATWTADVDRAGYTFVTAYAAWKQGDEATAGRLTETFVRSARDAAPRVQIMGLELEALRAVHVGQTEAAVSFLREAAAIEEGLPFEFGPPASLKPPHELLGETLLAAGRAADAADAFRAALDFTPGRVLAAQGLERATRVNAEQASQRPLPAPGTP